VEAVTGKIILGKFDPSLKAKSVIINGSSVQAEVEALSLLDQVILESTRWEVLSTLMKVVK
jgi:hypothetical protein